MANLPIWKDRIVSLQYNDQQPFTDFEVRTGQTVIFAGRAYNRPDASGQFRLGPEVKMNGIVADYLKQTFLPSIPASYVTWAPGFMMDASLYVGDALQASDSFYLDWSYDYGREPVRDSMHDPVDFRLDGRQIFIHSHPGAAADVRFVFSGGDTPSDEFVVQAERDSNVAFNLSFVQSAPKRLDIGGMQFIIDQGRCANRYVIHYVNAFGGWDCLLMSGQPLKSRAFDRKRMAVDYTNTEAMNRGSLDYANIIVTAWTLRTGLLTEAQSERMYHLLGSTLVYLEDLTEGLILPVVLTDTSADEITANGNGRRPIQYSINVQLAAERIRR